MRGAREYARLFNSGQIGRLFILSESHARGSTFHLYVLPDDKPVTSPRDGVEVYGIVSGNPGWTESYGWLHDGPWVKDFEELVIAKRKELAAAEAKRMEIKTKKEYEIQENEKAILSTYK